jgi:hypothetical protein
LDLVTQFVQLALQRAGFKFSQKRIGSLSRLRLFQGTREPVHLSLGDSVLSFIFYHLLFQSKINSNDPFRIARVFVDLEELQKRVAYKVGRCARGKELAKELRLLGPTPVPKIKKHRFERSQTGEVDSGWFPCHVVVIWRLIYRDETSVYIHSFAPGGPQDTECSFKAAQEPLSVCRRCEPIRYLPPSRLMYSRRQVSVFLEIWHHNTTISLCCG